MPDSAERAARAEWFAKNGRALEETQRRMAAEQAADPTRLTREELAIIVAHHRRPLPRLPNLLVGKFGA